MKRRRTSSSVLGIERRSHRKYLRLHFIPIMLLCHERIAKRSEEQRRLVCRATNGTEGQAMSNLPTIFQTCQPRADKIRVTTRAEVFDEHVSVHGPRVTHV
jgi:hypothetical protein